MEAMFVRRLQLFVEQLALTQHFGNVTTLRVWPAFEGAFGDMVIYRNCVASFAGDFFSTCAKVFLGVQVKTSNTVFNGGCRWKFTLDTSSWMHSCLYTTWKNNKGVAVEIILIVKGEFVNAVKNGGQHFILSGPEMNALANGGVVQKLGGALQLQSLSWQETVDKLGEIYNVQAFKANNGLYLSPNRTDRRQRYRSVLLPLQAVLRLKRARFRFAWLQVFDAINCRNSGAEPRLYDDSRKLSLCNCTN